MVYTSEFHLHFCLGAIFILFYNSEFQDFISVIDFSLAFKYQRRIKTSGVKEILY